MTVQRYDIKEAVNRIYRTLKGDTPPSDAPGALAGTVYSTDEAMSRLAELLQDSLPGESYSFAASVGDVFYVDPNTGSDVNTGAKGSPFASVTHAESVCAPNHNDIILVRPNNAWQYNNPADGATEPVAEEVTVTTPGISIIGYDPSNPLGVMWTPASNGGTCLTIHAVNVLVAGFVFDEGDYTGCNAISVVWDGVNTFGDNPMIIGNTFSDSVDIAISLEFTWYGHIINNTFWKCDDKGIYSVQPGSGIAYMTIKNNTFHDVVTTAMSLAESDNGEIANNSIYNSVAQSGASATDVGITTVDGDYNQVYNNYFSCIFLFSGTGDWHDMNTGASTDAWINNHCLDAMATVTPRNP